MSRLSTSSGRTAVRPVGSTVQTNMSISPALRHKLNNYKPPWIDEAIECDVRGMMFLPRVPDNWSPASPTHVIHELRGTKHDKIPRKTERRHDVIQPKYRYTPLNDNPDEIRTLRLLPGQEDDAIWVEMESNSLDSPPSYEAISYAWGNKDENIDIAVSGGALGCSVQVPRGLYGAFKQLRHRTESRTIWADAICINQEDSTEKNHQVQLMRRIYQRATRVIIWLGDYAPLDSEMGSLFELIGHIYHRELEVVPPPADRKAWLPLKKLFMLPWFRRVWCLQEAILAPSAEVMLGEHTVPWDYIGFAATWIRCMPFEMFGGDDFMVGVYHACLIYSLSHGREEQQHVSFLQLLTLTRAFEATDFRDKVYGILGIPTEDTDPDAGVTLLQPDYSKTLSEVYIDCALAVIGSTRSPRILSYVQHEPGLGWKNRHSSPPADESRYKVPSWIPRWHQYFARTLAPPDQEAKTFRASASLELDSLGSIHVRGLEMITRGARASRVRKVSQTFSDLFILEHFRVPSKTANEVWMIAAESLKASTPDTTEALYKLSTLLTAGKDWYGSIIEDREQHLADFLASMHNHRLPSRNHNVLEDLLFRPRTDLALPPATKKGQSHCFSEAMYDACNWRCLIITEDDQVGLGPQVTEPGDLVCILKDAIMPLLLRPQVRGDSFKLVGEAYIEGMMFGELSVPQVEEIVLSDKPFLDPVTGSDAGPA